jgi:hypothetical protein
MQLAHENIHLMAPFGWPGIDYGPIRNNTQASPNNVIKTAYKVTKNPSAKYHQPLLALRYMVSHEAYAFEDTCQILSCHA